MTRPRRGRTCQNRTIAYKRSTSPRSGGSAFWPIYKHWTSPRSLNAYDMKNLVISTITLFLALATNAPAQSLWEDVKDLPETLARKPGLPDRPMPSKYRLVKTDFKRLKAYLSDVPKEDFSKGREYGKEIELPLPDGGMGRFRVVELKQIGPDASDEIRSYYGRGVEDPSATVIMGYNPIFGFHGMFSFNQNIVYIDFQFLEIEKIYKVYYEKDGNTSDPSPFECEIEGEIKSENRFQELRSTVDCCSSIKRYKLALACTGEYTQWAVMTAGLIPPVAESVQKATASNMMQITVDRVNFIYMTEIGILMDRIYNDDLIHVNPATDPYPTAGTSGFKDNMFYANQSSIDNIIGNSNYDIGHVVSAAPGGGVARLGSVCNNDSKAKGYTQRPNPVGDPFNVDYVAHEMGHQFGANHTFSALNSGNCNANTINLPTAIEPGSGSTIMAYANICLPNNVQMMSDPYFHAISLEEIVNTTIIKTCATIFGCGEAEANGNTPPSANTGADYTIPKSTPFKLSGEGSDPDADPLLYCWEQMDLMQLFGPFQPPMPTHSSGPMFRSFKPTFEKYRYFPNFESLLASPISPAWEVLPAVPRDLNFRLTVRDINGCNATDDVKITVADSGPFEVTQPNTSEIWNTGCIKEIKWDVNGTDGGSVSCQLVNIYLVHDGNPENALPLALLTDNDGSHEITVPNISTTTGRIMVKAFGNIFFDISDQDITIEPAKLEVLDGVGSPVSPSTCTSSNCNGSIDVETNGGEVEIYEWSDGSGKFSPGPKTDLCPGIYTVTVTDKNLCTATGTYEVTAEHANLNITLAGGTSSSPILCFANTPITLSASVTGEQAAINIPFRVGHSPKPLLTLRLRPGHTG